MILVSLICCLLGIGYVQPFIYDHTQEQINVEYKARKDFYQEGEYLAFSLVEYCQVDMLESMFVDTPSFFTNEVIDSTYTMYEHLSDTKLVQVLYANGSSSDLGYSNGTDISYIRFTLTNAGSNVQYSYRFQTWSCEVRTTGAPTFVQRVNFVLYYNYLSSNTDLIYQQVKEVYFNLESAQSYVLVTKNNNLKNAYIASLDSTGAYDNGFAAGREVGFSEGEATGYQRGYGVGYAEGIDTDSTAVAIFTGILEVGLLPVNVFLQMFNYEVFGINIAGLVSGLITIAMIMIIIRFLFGGKENGK